MAPRPQVSVLIGTYNHGRFITGAIESVLGQTLPRADIEIVVVDDGSTDDTRARVEGYGHAVQYVYKDNGGQASAWNVGLTRCCGDVVAFLDADDVWHTEKLARVMAEFHRSPAVDVVSHVMTVVNDRGAVIGRIPDTRTHGGRMDDRKPLARYLVGKPPILPPTSGIAVKSAALARITPLPDDFRGGGAGPGPDLYVAYVLPFYADEFVLIPEALGTYRIHGPSLRDGGVAHPTVRHTEATLRSYRMISAAVDRAISRCGYDGRILRAKFEAMAHEAEMQLYTLRNQRLPALRLALRYRDPEFQGSAVRRAFRVLSVILSVLMPRGVYVSLRAWYRSTRLFDALHPHPDTATRPTTERRSPD